MDPQTTWRRLIDAHAIRDFETAKVAAEDLQDLRTRFERPWNRFHRVRVWTTILSFLMLLIGLVLSGKLL